MEEEKKEDIKEKIKKQVEELMTNLSEEGIHSGNVDYLYKLVDIDKDLENENYWKEKIKMRYRGYGNDSYMEGNYGRRMRDSRGRYMDEAYGRRGVDAKYREGDVRGDKLLDEMYQSYGEYSEGREEYGRGNYGAKEDTMKSLDYMLQSVEDFFKHLKKEASSQEEVEMIRETARKISEM